MRYSIYLTLLIIIAVMVSSCKQAGHSVNDQRSEELAESIEWATERHDVPTITVESAQALLNDATHGKSHLDNSPLFVDTRDPAEYKVSRIPGALLWPRDGSPPPHEIANALAVNRPVILYCSIGERSGAAGDELVPSLAERDILPLYNLAGGLFLWAEKGGPLEGGKLVHPYDEKWGKLLKPELRAPLVSGNKLKRD